MTPAEWQASDDPPKMLEYVRPTASERKLTLLAVAACRRIWHLIPDETLRQTVELAERWADEPHTVFDRRAAGWAAHGATALHSPVLGRRPTAAERASEYAVNAV